MVSGDVNISRCSHKSSHLFVKKNLHNQIRVEWGPRRFWMEESQRKRLLLKADSPPNLGCIYALLYSLRFLCFDNSYRLYFTFTLSVSPIYPFYRRFTVWGGTESVIVKGWSMFPSSTSSHPLQLEWHTILSTCTFRSSKSWISWYKFELRSSVKFSTTSVSKVLLHF